MGADPERDHPLKSSLENARFIIFKGRRDRVNGAWASH